MNFENQNFIVTNNSLILKIQVEKDISLISKVKIYDQWGDNEIENLSYAIRSEENENFYEIYFTFRHKTSYEVSILAKKGDFS